MSRSTASATSSIRRRAARAAIPIVLALAAAAVAAACTKPEHFALVVSDPADVSVTAGQPATFVVTAGNATAPTFQWYRGAATGAGTAIAGATDATFSITKTQLADAGAYYVVVTDGADTAQSRAATLTVVPAGAPPVITQQPVDVSVDVGGMASFTVAATGDPAPTFQWYVGAGASATAIPGATGATYTIPAVAALDANSYYAVATNPSGSATSSSATLTVTAAPMPPVITQQPTGVAVTVGHSTQLVVAASGSATLHYQWFHYVDGVNDTPVGTDSPTYAIASASMADFGTYYAVVSNAYGNATSNNGTVSVHARGTVTSFVISAQLWSPNPPGYTITPITKAFRHDYLWFDLTFSGAHATITSDDPGWSPTTYYNTVSQAPLLTDVVRPSYLFTITVTNDLGDADSYDYPLPVSPAGWTSSAATMSSPRYAHTATLLGDGTVVVIGGQATPNGGATLASADRYDPVADTFTPTGAMHAPRSYHTATLLADGRVLVTGGLSLATPGSTDAGLKSAEIYDPTTGQFTATADMTYARIAHTATLLPDGTVLIAGGASSVWDGYLTGGAVTTAELFDPKGNGGAGTFTPIASAMPDKIVAGVAVALLDGRVLVAGGNVADNPGPTSGPSYGDVYDPVAKTFTRASTNMTSHEGGRAAVRLPDGRVLLSEGEFDNCCFNPPYTADIEMFTPTANDVTAPGYPGTFTAKAPEIQYQRAFATLTALPDGTVLLDHGNELGVGGFSDGVLYDVAKNSWNRRNYLDSHVTRSRHTATWLPAQQRVLVIGGYNYSSIVNADAQLFRYQ